MPSTVAERHCESLSWTARVAAAGVRSPKAF
jgi:hypothetical protein